MSTRQVEPTSFLSLTTSWGVIRVAICNGCVCECRLPLLSKMPSVPLRIVAMQRKVGMASDRATVDAAVRFLKNVLRGKPAQGPRLAECSATDFMRRVWRELQRIPRGQVRAYGDVAQRIGRARAARAVGHACGANPLPLFVPCHRVVAVGQGLGGFSAGLPWKQRLLQLEGYQQE